MKIQPKEIQIEFNKVTTFFYKSSKSMSTRGGPVQKVFLYYSRRLNALERKHSLVFKNLPDLECWKFKSLAPCKFFLPNMTTDRGFMQLNGSKLGHSFSVTKSSNVARAIDISLIEANINDALIANKRNCSNTRTPVLHEFLNHGSFSNRTAYVRWRNPSVLST